MRPPHGFSNARIWILDFFFGPPPYFWKRQKLSRFLIMRSPLSLHMNFELIQSRFRPHECAPYVWFCPLQIPFIGFIVFKTFSSKNSFNATIVFWNFLPKPKIWYKMCKLINVSKLTAFWPIVSATVRIFQNGFLHWNHESELLYLNTVNTII